MPLIKCDSIKVLRNELVEQEKIRSSKIKFISGKPLEVDGVLICRICGEKTISTLGIYNGYSDCDDDISYTNYEYECKNYHNYRWRVIQ